MEKLNRFNKSNKKRNIIVIGVFLLVGLILVGVSYAVYQRVDEVRFINARVGEFETSSSDIELAMTLDGEDIDTPPEKGYYNIIVECDHANGSWDKNRWLAEIGSITSNRVKCNIKFETLEILPLSIVEVGDYISMTPTSTNYMPSVNLTGCQNRSNCVQNTINPSELNMWRVIKKNEDGTVEVVSEYVSSKVVCFYDKIGYINFVDVLNTVASQYTNEKYVEKTRHMGYSNQTLIINTSKINQTSPPWIKNTQYRDNNDIELYNGSCDTTKYLCGEYEALGGGDMGFINDYELVNNALKTMVAKTPGGKIQRYFLASRAYYQTGANGRFALHGRSIDTAGTIRWQTMYAWFDHDAVGASIRPILTLKSDIGIINGDGKSAETAYQLQ